MIQGLIMAKTSKARTSKVTFSRQERYSVNNSRLVLYKGCLIPYWEYRQVIKDE